MLRKEAVFGKLDLFDRQFEKQRMGDGEFGMRAYLEGFLNISNPNASRLHLKVGTGGVKTNGELGRYETKKMVFTKTNSKYFVLISKILGKQYGYLCSFTINTSISNPLQ